MTFNGADTSLPPTIRSYLVMKAESEKALKLDPGLVVRLVEIFD